MPAHKTAAMATYAKPTPGEGARKSPWLQAHFDKLASLKTGNEGLCLADVDGKGEGLIGRRRRHR